MRFSGVEDCPWSTAAVVGSSSAVRPASCRRRSRPAREGSAPRTEDLDHPQQVRRVEVALHANVQARADLDCYAPIAGVLHEFHRHQRETGGRHATVTIMPSVETFNLWLWISRGAPFFTATVQECSYPRQLRKELWPKTKSINY